MKFWIFQIQPECYCSNFCNLVLYVTVHFKMFCLLVSLAALCDKIFEKIEKTAAQEHLADLSDSVHYISCSIVSLFISSLVNFSLLFNYSL